MMSPHRILFIVLRVLVYETRNIFRPKKLSISYKLTFYNIEPLGSVFISIECVCKFHYKNDIKIKINKVMSCVMLLHLFELI